jgi:transposase-like protein
MRNILDAAPKFEAKELYPHLRTILDAPDLETARLLLNQTLEAYKRKAPRAIKLLEERFDDATAILAFPEKYRRRLRTTNGLERMNEEVRRREIGIRIFPTREPSIRLIGVLLMEVDNKWALGKKYLDMDEYLQWKKDQEQNHR